MYDSEPNNVCSIQVASKCNHFLLTSIHHMLFIFTIDPVISNFTVMLDEVVGLETTCEDSFDYDTFNLTCTASKPTAVLPELELFWQHNGTLHTVNSVITNSTVGDTFYITNILVFPTSSVTNSGLYKCTAYIIIPESKYHTEWKFYCHSQT